MGGASQPNRPNDGPGGSTDAAQAEGIGQGTKASLEGLVADKNVVVHPLVLLSVVDHYNRVASGTNKRVVGTLLGETQTDGTMHVTNSFAVPFEEDPKDPTVWFLDHCYHESLFLMFKKVNVKERVIGWYSTGPRIKPADLDIHELYRRYCPHPLYVIIDAKPKDDVLPTEAYMSFDIATSDKAFRRKFVHVPSSIDAYEPEEVGVEHLLRDIKNASTSTLSTQVYDRISSLKGLTQRLGDMAQYLQDVLSSSLPVNPKILYNFQNLLNLLPDLEDPSLVSAFTTDANDSLLALYLGSMLRSTLALHSLINNKIENKQNAEKQDEEQKKKKDEKNNKSKTKEEGGDEQKDKDGDTEMKAKK